MRIYLGGHLNFYHPQKDKWLEVELNQLKPLVEVLEGVGIPLGEVQLVVINGEVVDINGAVVSPRDEVRLFSAVGGG